MLIGSDSETIEFVPSRDSVLLDAIESMLSIEAEGGKPSITRTAIRNGIYGPRASDIGRMRFARNETVISIYRLGRLPLLDLVLWCCPNTTAERGESDVVDPNDEAAAELVGSIARGSAMRAEDGKTFWSGFFGHRVRRFARLPLSDCVSRLMTECAVPPSSDGARRVSDILRTLSPEEVTEIERAIRQRTDLVLALAYHYRTVTGATL